MGNSDYYVAKLKNTTGALLASNRWNGAYNLNDVVSNMVVTSTGDIYVAGQEGVTSNNGPTYKYALTKWSEKTVWVPVPSNGYSSSGGYITNKEQLRNEDGSGNETVKFYNQNHRVATYVNDTLVAYQLVQAMDSTDQDTTFRVDMKFTKGSPNAKVFPFSERKEYHNYYLGHMSGASERTAIVNNVIKSGVYTNTDVIYTHSPSGFRHLIVARSGAPTADFEMTFTGQSSLSVDGSGKLVIATSIGNIIFSKAKAYTMNNTTGVLTLLGWQPSYSISGSAVSFTSFGSWSGTLVLEFGEPAGAAGQSVDDWSTYWGGAGTDSATDIVVDQESNIYVAGQTESLSFPNIVGGAFIELQSLSDVFVAKFNESGTALVGTFFGGNGYDVAYALAQNNEGDIYIVGRTWSDNLPVLTNAGDEFQGQEDGYIVRFSNGLNELLFSRYLGGDNDFFTDLALDVAVNENDEVYVVGMTCAGDNSTFPILTMNGAYNQQSSSISSGSNPDGYILKFSSGNQQLWGTYFGGGEYDDISNIDLKPNGEIRILGSTFSDNAASSSIENEPGEVPSDPDFFPNCESEFGFNELFHENGANQDMFYARFWSTGALTYCTYLGGTGHETSMVSGYHKISTLINDPSDPSNVYIIGTTTKTNFYASSLSLDAYIQSDNLNGSFPMGFIFAIDGSNLQWGTVFGSSSQTFGIGAAMDMNQNLFLSGVSIFSEYGDTSCEPTDDTTDEFPQCESPDLFFQSQNNGGQGGDSYIASFNGDYAMQWCTFFGGSSNDELRASAFDLANNRLYLVGRTNSGSNFPLFNPETDNYQQNNIGGTFDAFISRFDVTSISDGIAESSSMRVGMKMNVFPNPSQGNLCLNIESTSKESGEVRITNVMGEILFSQKANIQNGKESIQIDVSNFASGAYTISFVSGYIVTTSSFILNK